MAYLEQSGTLGSGRQIRTSAKSNAAYRKAIVGRAVKRGDKSIPVGGPRSMPLPIATSVKPRLSSSVKPIARAMMATSPSGKIGRVGRVVSQLAQTQGGKVGNFAKNMALAKRQVRNTRVKKQMGY